MQERFKVIRDCGRENSFGPVGERATVELQVTVEVNDEKNYGSFEFYDIESAGNRFYAEGGLWFEDRTLVDYDGMFCISDFILDSLEENGYDVASMREACYPEAEA